MKKKTNIFVIIVIAVLAIEAWALCVITRSPVPWRQSMVVQDEPKARALYEAMLQEIEQAESLSYRSMCWGTDGRFTMYQIQLMCPGMFQVILTNGTSPKETVVTDDGKHFRVHWSGLRPYLKTDDFDSYEKTRSDVYIERPHGSDPISVRGPLAELGIGWYEMILDGGMLFGRSDPLEPYIDGICCRGTNKAAGELCDVIEISYMQAQRTRHIWLSRKDHLPRRIKDINRLTEPRVTVEEWFNVKLNPQMAVNQLTWSPPESWRSFTPRSSEDLLLSPGRKAPNFEMTSMEGETIRLSDYQGKTVWLYFWQVGEPLCHEQLPRLQSFYENHRDKDLIVIGINVSDDKGIAQRFLDTIDITFPIGLDSSEAARKTVSEGYHNKDLDVPLSYLIDPNGILLDAWFGPEQDHLSKLGTDPSL